MSLIETIEKYAAEHGLPLAAHALATHLEGLSPDQKANGVDKVAEAIKAFTPAQNVVLSDDHASALAHAVLPHLDKPADAPKPDKAPEDPPAAEMTAEQAEVDREASTG